MNVRANRIRKQRKSLAYSVKELANLSNISEKNIIAYEKNEIVATLKTIKKIAESTKTNINDWVDDEYFEKIKEPENELFKSDEDMLFYFFRSMFRADNVIETLNDALMDINEIRLGEHNEIILSDFSKELYESVSKIKIRRIFEACGRDSLSGAKIESENYAKDKVKSDRNKKDLSNVTPNNLMFEMKMLFKNTDVIDVILQALININAVDGNGKLSEKATTLLDAIISNKAKKLLLLDRR